MLPFRQAFPCRLHIRNEFDSAVMSIAESKVWRGGGRRTACRYWVLQTTDKAPPMILATHVRLVECHGLIGRYVGITWHPHLLPPPPPPTSIGPDLRHGLGQRRRPVDRCDVRWGLRQEGSGVTSFGQSCGRSATTRRSDFLANGGVRLRPSRRGGGLR